MQVPEKCLKFLELIHEQLQYIKGGIVVFDATNLLQKEFSPEDIKYILHFLSEKNLILRKKALKVAGNEVPTILEEGRQKYFRWWASFALSFGAAEFKYFYIIQLVSREKFLEFYRMAQGAKNKTSGEVAYANGVLTFGEQKYVPESDLRKSMLDLLWYKKKVFKNEKVFLEGELFPKDAAAVQIGLISENRDFVVEKERFKNEITALNRIFREKDFPLEISGKGGVQLIEKR